MPTYLFTRTLAGLAPLNDDARDWLRRKKVGAIIKGEFVEPRNGARLRKYWALIDLVYDNLPDRSGFATREHFEDALRIGAGYFDMVELPSGKKWPRPKSIAFASMPEPEFQTLMDKVVELVRTRFLPTVTDAELRAQLEEMTR
jgi:hypothetical protein